MSKKIARAATSGKTSDAVGALARRGPPPQPSVARARAHARALYRLAGFDPAEPAGAKRLTDALLGPGAVRRTAAAYLYGAQGEIYRHPQGWRVLLSDALSSTEAVFVAYHELAHWYFGIGAHGAAVEAACDAVATVLFVDVDGFDVAEIPACDTRPAGAEVAS